MKKPTENVSEKISDAVTKYVGSWRFILIQSAILAVWIYINSTQGYVHWDEYPYILLNLMLSFQAAYSTPFILMSQNRESKVDRAKANLDLKIGIIVEKEINELLNKIKIRTQNDNLFFEKILKNQKDILDKLENK
jgi:uncharacterized membrane protein